MIKCGEDLEQVVSNIIGGKYLRENESLSPTIKRRISIPQNFTKFETVTKRVAINLDKDQLNKTSTSQSHNFSNRSQGTPNRERIATRHTNIVKPYALRLKRGLNAKRSNVVKPIETPVFKTNQLQSANLDDA